MDRKIQAAVLAAVTAYMTDLEAAQTGLAADGSLIGSSEPGRTGLPAGTAQEVKPERKDRMFSGSCSRLA